MPRFFLEDIAGDTAQITGEDARHISRVLRMGPGREIIISDTKGVDYTCRILTESTDLVTVRIISSAPCKAETKTPIKLYQAMPKGDKLEHIIQKAVELGAAEVTPVMTSRCISRPGARGMERKLQRWQRIAYEAAKQSGRGIIPAVKPLLNFSDAICEMSKSGLAILFYEESESPLRSIAVNEPESVAVMIGSEGGFSAAEAEFAREKGVFAVSLGPRILRCETAPVCALSALLYNLGEI